MKLEAKQRLEAAKLTTGMQKRFYKGLEKALQKAGMDSTLSVSAQRGSAMATTEVALPVLVKLLKKIGWTTVAKKGKVTVATRADGTWPIELITAEGDIYLRVTTDDGSEEGKRNRVNPKG